MKDKYAFLMIEYEMPDIIRNIHNLIKPDEIYDNGSNEYGIENECHVTLVPCLDCNTNLNKLKIFLNPIEDYRIVLTDISIFNNDEYDVLKCNVYSDNLFKTNAEIKKYYPTYTEFNEYKPHMTIAYLNKGCGEKYKKDSIEKLIILNPLNFYYSYYDENGCRKNVKFK